MKNRVLVLVFLILICFLILSCSSSKTVQPSDNPTEQAEALFERGLYDEAETAYSEIINNDPTNTKAVLGLVNLYTETSRQESAVNILKKQLSITSKPVYHSRLASLYEDQGLLSESLEQLHLFQKGLPVDHPNIRKAQTQIDQLNYSIELMSKPYKVEIEPLSKDINTSENNEYQPRFTIDNSEVVFTRKVNGQEDLFTATIVDSTYRIQPISAINTRYNEGAQTISGDGRYLIFTHCNDKAGYGSCDLYESLKINGQWSRPKNIGSPINTSGWESQPSLSTDGSLLYFAATYANGEGQSDLWISQRTKSGWTKPKNLGPTINTAGRDESPFIHADGKSLYFRSTGHRGIGSYDLFLSTINNETWSTPENMGYPINSVGEERDLVVSLDGLTGYYSSDSYGGVKMESLDIYKFSLPQSLAPAPMTYVKCQVADAESKEPIIAQVLINDLNNNLEVFNQSTDIDGALLTAVEVGKNLGMQVSAEGYSFWSEHFNYEDSRYGQSPYLKTIYLTKIKNDNQSTADLTVTDPIVLKNIFFETGSAKLLQSSNQEIMFLYAFLISNDVSITILGHTDNVGNENDNLALSQNRADALKQKMTELGINPSRINSLGRGESYPIASNDDEIGRAKNRRTEVLIKK